MTLLCYFSRGLAVNPDSIWLKLGITRFHFYRWIYNTTRDYPIFNILMQWFSRKKTKIVISKSEATEFGKIFCRPFGLQLTLRPMLQTLFHMNDYDNWLDTRKVLVNNIFKPAQVEAMSDTISACALESLSELEQLVEVVSLARRYIDKVFYRCIFDGDLSDENDFHLWSAELRHEESKLLKKGGGLYNIVSKAELYFKDLIWSQNNNQDSITSVIKRVFTSTDIIESSSVSFILGGYTASVSTLVCAMFELSQNEQIQEEVRTELLDSQALGIPSDSCMNKFLKEVMRKYPPFSAVLKEDKDKVIWVLPISGIHHDQQIYPNPSQFSPERFANTPLMYYPFGIGKRKCPGEFFANTIVKLFLKHVLLSKYLKPSSNSGGQELQFTTYKFTTAVDRLDLLFENSDPKIK